MKDNRAHKLTFVTEHETCGAIAPIWPPPGTGTSPQLITV